MGLEPTTSAVTGRRSNQLSHRALITPSKLYTAYLFRHFLSYDASRLLATVATKPVIRNPLRFFLMSFASQMTVCTVCFIPECKHSSFQQPLHTTAFSALGQALDLLVTVSSMCYHTSTSALSTLSSSRGLTSFEWDISS